RREPGVPSAVRNRARSSRLPNRPLSRSDLPAHSHRLIRDGSITVPDVVRELPHPIGLTPINVQTFAYVFDRPGGACWPGTGGVRNALQRGVTGKVDMG